MTLEEAQETIARQREEIERLRRRLSDERFMEDLREALALAGAVGAIGAPVSHARLLEMIVRTATHVISARAGSLLLVDEGSNDLLFEVAVGGEAEQVKEFRVPLGHGIAGLVAVTGQAMAVSDASRDPRQARDIAERVGYVPESILCVPLFYDGDVIGVLELLDKEGAPSFNAADMEALGLFASQAAVAIEQSRIYRSVSALMNEALGAVAGMPPDQASTLRQRATAYTSRFQDEDPAYRRTLDLATLVQEIAQQGEGEAAACRTILQSFADYLRSRDGTGGEREEL